MSRWLLAVVVASALCVLLLTPCTGLTYGFTQEYFRPGNLRLYINSPSKKIACRFVAPSSIDGKTVNAIYAYPIAVYGTPPFCRIGIQSDLDGLPSGNWLSSAVFSPGNAGAFQKTPIPPCTISGGTTYHVVIQYESGRIDSSYSVAYSYACNNTHPEMVSITDYGSGWIVHPDTDPSFALGFTDGSKYGQPYVGNGEYRIFGNGQNSGFGQQILLDEPMTVRRVSFKMRISGRPSAPCYLAIKDMTSGVTLVDEPFCTASSFSRSAPSFANFYWIGHDLGAPLQLASGRPYLVWLHQENFAGDSSNCYRVRYDLSDWSSAMSPLTWNGTNSFAGFISSPSGTMTAWLTMDCLFRLDTSSVAITYRYLTCVTPSTATVVVRTSRASNVTVDYGETTDYGRTAVSGNGLRHELVLTGLEPGKRYHYKITAVDADDPTNTTDAQDSEFRIPQPTDNVTADIVGDSQQLTFLYTLGQAKARNGDLLLTVGDNVELANSITNSTPTLDDARLEWQQFLTLVVPGTWSPGFYTAIGNHDNTNVAGCKQAYQEELTLPTNGGSELYYSFDYGPAHFVVLDSVSVKDMTIDQAQYDWLRQDLASTTKPWKIALLHYIVKGASYYDPHYSWWMLKNASDIHNLFVQYGVRLVLQGHMHVYNRYQSGGVYYVTNTTLHADTAQVPSADELPYSGQQAYSNTGGSSGTLPAYVNMSGSMRLAISTKQIGVSFIDAADRVLDQFSVAPQTFHLTWPTEGAQVSSGTPVMSWTPCTDDGSGLDRYELWVDGALNVARVLTQWNSCIPAGPLSNGQHTWTVAAVNKAGVRTFAEETYTINVNANGGGDTTPPTNPSTVVAYSDPGMQTQLQTSQWYQYRQPCFIWNGAGDDESGVAGYYVYFGLDPTADPVRAGVFITDASYTSAAALTDGLYYLRMCTVDRAGNTAAVYSAFTYKLDTTPPSVPGQPWTPSATANPNPTWRWTPSTDAGSGLAGYYVNVMNDATQDVVTEWLWVGSDSVWTQTPALGPGTYICEVYAIDNSGLCSQVSDSGLVEVISDQTIALAKASPTGAVVALSHKVVTAVFRDCFYIEEPGRSAAIRIDGGYPCEVGHDISLNGNAFKTNSTEPYISPVMITYGGYVGELGKLFVTQKVMQDGINDKGLDVSGMLVGTAGRVTALAPDGFYIDDGSGVQEDPSHKGVKVSTDELAPGTYDTPSVGEYFRVYGIVCYRGSSSHVLPMVKCRESSDVKRCTSRLP